MGNVVTRLFRNHMSEFPPEELEEIIHTETKVYYPEEQGGLLYKNRLYSNGKIYEQKEYWPNGQICSHEFFKNGKPYGIRRQWLPNGTLSIQEIVGYKKRTEEIYTNKPSRKETISLYPLMSESVPDENMRKLATASA